MIDLHCHILPGIDDGPSSMAECIDMARIAYAEGIRTIVATPHVKDGSPSADEIGALVDDLNASLRENGVVVTILPGAEVQAHAGVIAASTHTLNRANYVLLEFQHNFISIRATALLFDYLSKGIIPVLSHAERSPSVIETPEILSGIIEMGCLVQITSASVTGGFGPEIRACAHHLLKNRMAHVLATDAHSATWRPPLISDALSECKRLIGAKAASSLVNETPNMIISGAGRD